MKYFSKINIYLIKNFLLYFCIFLFVIFALVLMADFIEISRKMNSDISLLDLFMLSFLEQFRVLSELIPFAIFLSGVYSFLRLNNRSEILIIRVSGLSIIRIILPVAITSFLLGVLSLLILNPATIKFSSMAKEKKEQMFKKDNKKDNQEWIRSKKGGVWFRVEDIDNNLIHVNVKKYNLDKMEFDDAKIISFDRENYQLNFIASATSLKLLDNKDNKASRLLIENITISKKTQFNEFYKNKEIRLTSESDIVKKQILSDYQDVETISFIKLPLTIQQLKDSNFDTSRHEAYFFKLLSWPFLFFTMIIVAANFCFPPPRSNKMPFIISTSIIVGFIIYFAINVLYTLGFNQKIGLFPAIVSPILLIFAISYLLALRKESF